MRPIALHRKGVIRITDTRFNGGRPLNSLKPIYRAFADLDSEREADRFARRHGPLGSWRDEQKDVRRVIEHWDAIRRDPDEYGARIRDPHRKALDRPGRDPRTTLEKRRADLAREVNHKLLAGGEGREPLVSVHFPADWSGLQVTPMRVGNSGLAAVWWTLAQAISGQGAFRDCPVCLVAFEPSRSDARFCSPACKLKAHRSAHA